MAGQRYHFLDGLRGVAMLLGIVLHGGMSFLGFPVWPAVDVKSDPELFWFMLDVIHGFRMPLFFLVSGFFTAMMWKKRGGKGMLKQRLLRIGVPLVIGTMIMFPIMVELDSWGSEVTKEWSESSGGEGLSAAIYEGDLGKVDKLLAAGADANEKDDSGSPVLHLAAVVGQGNIVESLLKGGAEIDGKGADGDTALMAAAFFGRVEVVQVLIGAGADVNAENRQGNTVLQTATMDFSIVEMVGEMLAVPIDEEMPERREECARLLIEVGALDQRDGSMDWYWIGVYFPVFHHLWFLYYLLWLVAIFLPVALIGRKIGKRIPDWVIKTPGCLLWLIPLTLWPQTGMPGMFGPGTAVGIFPWGTKLGYYAIFFFFGALCFGRGWWEEKAGSKWWVWLLAAVPFFWFGREWVRGEEVLKGQVCAVFYAWLVIIAMIGLFRRFLNGGHPKWRYLSDSSYWLYLAHLPLIIALQIFLSDLDFPAIPKFLFICFAVTSFLLLIYRYFVRYTWIGAILNGRKHLPPEESSS